MNRINGLKAECLIDSLLEDTGMIRIVMLEMKNNIAIVLYFVMLINALASTCTASQVNLIQNNAFEAIGDTARGASLWILFGRRSLRNDYVSIVSDCFNGSCLKIATNKNNKPWAMQKIPVVEDAEYEVSTDLKIAKLAGGSAVFKIEFYKERKNLGCEQTLVLSSAPHDWKKISKLVRTLKGANFMCLYLRITGKGVSYWDNVSCAMVANPPIVCSETDNIFYYSNWQKGLFTLAENRKHPSLQGSKYTVSIINKSGAVLKSESGIFRDLYTLEFDIAMLKNIGEAYTIEYSLVRKGITFAKGSNKVYRYNRPTYIGDDNTFEINGKNFFPVIGYHVQPSDYDYCLKAGINVIQYFPKNYDDSKIFQSLDEMQRRGLMAFVVLYDGQTAARQEYLVNLVKKHPAVFGYMLYDEPVLNGANLDKIRDTYRIVRNNDDVHPTYIVEGQTASSRYGEIAKYSDIFAVDPYPGCKSVAMYNTEKHIALAKKATNNKKPVVCINEIMTKSWHPSSDDIRNMNYQAFFAGASGIGYYDVRDYYGYNNGKYDHMWQRESYKGIMDFARCEQSLAYRAFVLNKFKIVALNMVGRMWYKCFDAGDGIYCVVINKSSSVQKTKINLMLDNNMHVNVINGTKPKNISRNGNYVCVTLNGGEAAAFMLTAHSRLEQLAARIKADEFFYLGGKSSAMNKRAGR
ncbi:MAG: hypothetical protein JW832_04415 [Deltaproteobacteria bacterium]|nr:hypothetical protein [Deltaproteobacteria bacterium]